MKKRFKILTSTIALSSLVPQLIWGLTSCNEFSDPITKKISDDMIQEFFALSKAGQRDTFHTKNICVYLFNRIGKIMGWTEQEKKIYIHTDEGSGDDDGYKGKIIQWFREKGLTPPSIYELGYNICFDLEPNDPNYQNAPTFIVQAHTDMVWTTRNDGEYIPTHPEPMLDMLNGKKIIHTKHNLSSLGADNGIGVATILSLAKNRNLFKHGKIRFLLTTDEEDGPSGSAYVPHTTSSNWYKIDIVNPESEYFNYLINIDLENACTVCDSCSGFVQTSWTKEFEVTKEGGDEPVGNLGWKVSVSGLKGGHSAKEIDKKRINSVSLGAKILTNLINYTRDGRAPYFDILQLFRFYEVPTPTEGEDFPEIKTNVIPHDLTFCFATTGMRAGEQAEVIRNVVKKTIMEETSKYTGDNFNEINWSVTRITQSDFVQGRWSDGGTIPTEETKKLVAFLSKLEYGVRETSGFLPSGTPKTSCNISGARLIDNRSETEPEKVKVLIELMGRSVDMDDLGLDPTARGALWDNGFMEKYVDAAKSVFGDGKYGDFFPYAYNVPWFPSKHFISDYIFSAGKQCGYHMKKFDEHSWLELSELAKNSENKIDITAIGPTIVNAHSVNEYLEVDSIPFVINTLRYTFENIIKGGRNEK